MKINWIKVSNNNGEKIEYSFNDKNIYFMDNDDGKTLVVSYILWSLGISYDLSKENQKDSIAVISISKGDNEIIIKRTGSMFLGYFVNEEKILSRKRGLLFKEIFNIFQIPFINSHLSSLFKSLMNPGIVLQSHPYKENGFIEFYGDEDKDIVRYIYLANAFRDEFALSDLHEEVEKCSKIIKDNSKIIGKKKILLDLLSNNEWTVNDDERLSELESLTEDLKLFRKKLIVTISKKSEQEYINQKITKNKDFADVWRQKYKGMYAFIDGKKFTISDFLLEFSQDDHKLEINLKKINDISLVKENIEHSIEQINKRIEKIKKQLDRDFVVLRNADTSKLEKELFSLISENEYYKNCKAIANGKIDDIDDVDVRGKLANIVDNLDKKIGASNGKGKYKWLKFNFKSGTGSSAVVTHLGMLELAVENKGLETPFILDSPFESIQADKMKLFMIQTQKLCKNNQLIIFTNKKEYKNLFINWNSDENLNENQKKLYDKVKEMY